MRKDFADLGKTEWTLLNICWKKGSKTSVKEIYEESLKEKIRSYATVKTMLDRLVIKGYLQREKFGPIWLYTPEQNQRQVVSQAIDDFIKTVLGDNTIPFFKHLVENREKYQYDLEELRNIIKKIDEKEDK